MGLQISAGNEFKPIPLGRTPAVCVGYIDMGTQETSFGDKRQIRIMFDLPQRRADFDGVSKPMRVSVKENLTIKPKSKLLPLIEEILGRKLTAEELSGGFDIDQIVGKTCKVKIAHVEKKNGTGKFNAVESVISLDEGEPTFPMECEPIKYALFDQAGKIVEPTNPPLWPWIIEIIKGSREYKAHLAANDTPF